MSTRKKCDKRKHRFVPAIAIINMSSSNPPPLPKR